LFPFVSTSSVLFKESRILTKVIERHLELFRENT